MYIVTGPDRLFVSPWKEEFVYELASLVNAGLELESERLISAEELAELHQPLLVFPPDQLSAELL